MTTLDRTFDALHVIVDEVEETERINLRNAGTDRNARIFIHTHGRALLTAWNGASPSSPDLIQELRQRADQIGTRLSLPPQPQPDAERMRTAADRIELLEKFFSMKSKANGRTLADLSQANLKIYFLECALQAAQAWIADGGHAESGSGREIYQQITKALSP